MKASLIAGIDVSAETFVVSVALDGHEQFNKQFLNSLDGVEAFLKAVAAADLDVNSMQCCLERTGVYSEHLCYALNEKGIAIAIADAQKVRRTAPDPNHKSDEHDSRLLADYARRFGDRLQPWQPDNVVVERINILLRTRDQFVKQRVASVTLLQTWKRKWVKDQTANATLERTIAMLESEIKALEKEIRKLINDNPSLKQGFSLLVSVPGVGLMLAANLLVMTTGLTKDVNYRQAASYLGIAPRPYESGTSVKRGSHSRGYGPSVLRSTLHMSVRSALRCNDRLKGYFVRKKAEGKPGRLVMNNLANKQLKLIFAVVNSRQPYNKNYRSFNPSLLTKP